MGVTNMWVKWPTTPLACCVTRTSAQLTTGVLLCCNAALILWISHASCCLTSLLLQPGRHSLPADWSFAAAPGRLLPVDPAPASWAQKLPADHSAPLLPCRCITASSSWGGLNMLLPVICSSAAQGTTGCQLTAAMLPPDPLQVQHAVILGWSCKLPPVAPTSAACTL